MNALTLTEFETKLQEGKPFAIDFYADWCQACMEMMPIVNEVAETSEIPFYKINIDDQPEMKDRMKIKAIPMLMIFNKGRVREFVYGKAERNTIQRKLTMAQK